MKTLIGIILIALLSSTLSAQKSIDALFEKYAGKDGFVTVTINGNFLKFTDTFGEDDDMPKNITFIRILAEDEDNKASVENFHDLATKELDLSKYEEFMRVKESRQDVRMLVRMEGNRFTEFLLIAGGEDNALIQIKGDMSMDEARKFADNAKKDHGTNILNNRE